MQGPMGDTGYRGPAGATGPRGRQPFGSGVLVQGIYGMQADQVSVYTLATQTPVQPKILRVAFTGSTPTGTYVGNVDGTTGYTSTTVSGLDQGNPINTYDDPLNFLIGDINAADPNHPVLLTLDHVPAGTYLVRGFSSPPTTSSVNQNFTTLRWQGGGPTGTEGSDLVVGTLARGNGTSFLHYYGTLTSTNTFEGFQYTDSADNFDWGSSASSVAARLNFIRLTSPSSDQIASNVGPTGYSPTGTGATFGNMPTNPPTNMYFVVSSNPSMLIGGYMATINFDGIANASYYIYGLYYAMDQMSTPSLINSATGSSSTYTWNISNGFQPTFGTPLDSAQYYASMQPYGGPYTSPVNKNPFWSTLTVTISNTGTGQTSWGATGYNSGTYSGGGVSGGGGIVN